MAMAALPRVVANDRTWWHTLNMATQSNGRTENLRPFPKGVSGNPSGRPKGLAKATRELVGEDGVSLVRFWLSIVEDENARTTDRLEASRLLAERGWGKAAAFAVVEDTDPLGLEDAELAAGELRAEIVRLAGLRKAAYKPS
jgi:Family of unknown function (DUF5681)